MPLPRRLRRFFLEQLYHRLAFLYDAVAAAVSFGHWNDWVLQVVPYLEGNRVLELGHGPGHLQRALLDRRPMGLSEHPRQIFGLDASLQMSRLARRRLIRAGHRPNLVRAQAQALPFASHSFDTVVVTFPTEYIFSPHTLAETRRVLRYHGRLVILLLAWPRNPGLNWLYRLTGQTPDRIEESSLGRELIGVFSEARFQSESRFLETESATLLLVIATKA